MKFLQNRFNGLYKNVQWMNPLDIYIAAFYNPRLKPWAINMKFLQNRFNGLYKNVQMDKSIGYKSLHFIAHGLNRGQ